jgi:4-amino-4-deoxy-L-arabinose transferase-like glycosyltransferase
MFVLIPIIVFSILFSQGVGSIPYLDGNIQFLMDFSFHSGGLEALLGNSSWGSVHPPFKQFVSSVFFSLFGVNQLVYTSIGWLIGICAIYFFYQLTKSLINKSVAKTSGLFLAASPIFISVGLFSLADYYLTLLIIASFLALSKRKYPFYALAASLAILTKETGFVLAVSVFFSEFIQTAFSYWKTKSVDIGLILKNLFLIISPLIVGLLWIAFLNSQDAKVWGDWNFSQTADKGTIYTIYHNLISGDFLNKYAYQNWQQLFLLNLNWIYWLVIVGGSFLSLPFIIKRIKTGKFIFTAKVGTISTIIVFFIAYNLSVLSFQTYTIPRYSLPLIPIMLLAFSYFLLKIEKFFHIRPIYSVVFFAPILFLQLFLSVDPVSNKIWGKTIVLGQEIYALNRSLAGNDGITYNLQYLLISKNRTRIINSENPEIEFTNIFDCYWLFPDVNNDRKTAKILKLNDSPAVNLCLNQ